MPSPPDDSYEDLVLELSVDEIEDDDGEPEVAKGKETSEGIDDGVVGVDVEEAGEKPPGGEPRKEGGDEDASKLFSLQPSSLMATWDSLPSESHDPELEKTLSRLKRSHDELLGDRAVWEDASVADKFQKSFDQVSDEVLDKLFHKGLAACVVKGDRMSVKAVAQGVVSFAPFMETQANQRSGGGRAHESDAIDEWLETILFDARQSLGLNSHSLAPGPGQVGEDAPDLSDLVVDDMLFAPPRAEPLRPDSPPNGAPPSASGALGGATGTLGACDGLVTLGGVGDTFEEVAVRDTIDQIEDTQMEEDDQEDAMAVVRETPDLRQVADSAQALPGEEALPPVQEENPPFGNYPEPAQAPTLVQTDDEADHTREGEEAAAAEGEQSKARPAKRKENAKSTKDAWQEYLATSSINQMNILRGKRTRAPNAKYTAPSSQPKTKRKKRGDTENQREPNLQQEEEEEDLRGALRSREERILELEALVEREQARHRASEACLRKEISGLKAEVKRRTNVERADPLPPQEETPQRARRRTPRSTKADTGAAATGTVARGGGKGEVEGRSGQRSPSKVAACSGAGPLFKDMVFVLTSFAKDEKKKIAAAITANGGSVVEDVRPQLSAAAAAAAATTIVVAKDQTRTIKLLLGIVAGLPIVKPAWIQTSVQVGVPMELEGRLVWRGGGEGQDGGKRVFDDKTFVLYGSQDFLGSELRSVLLAGGGAWVCVRVCEGLGSSGRAGAQASLVGPKGERVRRRDLEAASAIICENAACVQKAQRVFAHLPEGLCICESKVFNKAIAQGTVKEIISRS